MAENPKLCTLYLPTKGRHCKFPAVGPDGFCVFHCQTFRGRERVPCPLAPTHTVYRSKLLTHLRGCTETRDLAWELCQPYCNESVNDPFGNCDHNIAHKSTDVPNELTLREKCDAAFLAGWTWTDFVEKRRLPSSISISDPPSQHDLTRLLQEGCSTDLQDGVQSIYEKCCKYLEVDPNYYLAGIVSEFPNEERDRQEKQPLSPAHFRKSNLLPFLHCWNSEGSQSELFRDIVMSISKGSPQFGCLKVPLPLLNKHQLQNASIVALCYLLGYLEPTPTVIIEFGAGRGALTRWFVLASRRADNDESRFILIDREKRRNNAEGKSEKSELDRQLQSESILRLRLDIRDFDFGQLLASLLGHAKTEVVSQGTPRLLQFLELFGAANLPSDPIEQPLKRQKLPPNNAEQPCEEGGSSYVQQQLLSLCERTNVQAQKVVQQAGSNFSVQWLSTHSKSRVRLLSTAKHLCGGATDAALRAICNGIAATKCSAPQNTETTDIEVSICLAIAPCCHHRCLWETTLGQQFLSSLGLSSADFAALVSMSGWGTGATGVNQRVGIMSKRIIDCARIHWLHQNGFEDASLIHFVSGKPTTLENVIIVGNQERKSQITASN